ncbi:MAG TPA: tyrosine-protein phosphatase [Mucilaginibacter sp.]|jgi:protein-tyrosine phosphatase|nr:tyrosine-protein phosphatase [Mucilaginibacter sp.]
MKKIFLFFIAAVAYTSVTYAQIADSAKRHVVLQGAANFRDLGGYQTADGHHVKWGEVYRSADISKLTDADLAKLKSLNLGTDVDLRGHQESAQAPDKLNPGTDYILCPAGSDNMNWAKEMSKIKGNQTDSLMIVYYSNTQYLADRYKPLFDKLLSLPDGQSLVFHCTAGKDRTGIGSALFLYSLGVPYDTIVSDYLASNYYRKGANAKLSAQMAQAMHFDLEVARTMSSVKKEWLDATFDAIKKQYGSVDNYLKTQLGLDDQKIAELKKKFLEQ